MEVTLNRSKKEDIKNGAEFPKERMTSLEFMEWKEKHYPQVSIPEEVFSKMISEYEGGDGFLDGLEELEKRVKAWSQH